MHPPSWCVPRRADLSSRLIRIYLFHGVFISILIAPTPLARESRSANLGSLYYRLSGIAYSYLESDHIDTDLLHLGKGLHLLSANVLRVAGSYAHHGQIDQWTIREGYTRLVPYLADWQCPLFHHTLLSLFKVQFFSSVDHLSGHCTDYPPQHPCWSLSNQGITGSARCDRWRFFRLSAPESVYVSFREDCGFALGIERDMSMCNMLSVEFSARALLYCVICRVLITDVK